LKRVNAPILIVTLGLLLAVPGLRAQSARVRAMGGAYLALPDAGTDNAFLNPAGLSQVDRTEMQAGSTVSPRNDFRADHLAWTGLFYESSSERKVTLEDYLESDYEFRTEPERVSNWAYGASFSKEERSPELSERLGRGYIRDSTTTFRLSAGTRFPIAERLTSRPELYGGFRVRYSDRDRENPRLKLRAKAEVWNLDLGGYYKASERLTVGTLLRSVVSLAQDKSAGARNESASMDLGGAYILGENRDTTVALDFKNIFNGSRTVPSEIRLGVERRFLDNDFALRVGSWDGVLTMGFGVKFFEDFRMDYSYSNFTDIKEHHLSFQLPFSIK
jgi:hypothetical protein